MSFLCQRGPPHRRPKRRSSTQTSVPRRSQDTDVILRRAETDHAGKLSPTQRDGESVSESTWMRHDSLENAPSIVRSWRTKFGCTRQVRRSPCRTRQSSFGTRQTSDRFIVWDLGEIIHARSFSAIDRHVCILRRKRLGDSWSFVISSALEMSRQTIGLIVHVLLQTSTRVFIIVVIVLPSNLWPFSVLNLDTWHATFPTKSVCINDGTFIVVPVGDWSWKKKTEFYDVSIIVDS